MNAEHGKFGSGGSSDAPARLDAEIAAAIENARLDSRSAHLFVEETEEEEAAAIARIRADMAAGRCVPHKDVVAWLKTVDSPAFKPMPRAWLR